MLAAKTYVPAPRSEKKKNPSESVAVIRPSVVPSETATPGTARLQKIPPRKTPRIRPVPCNAVARAIGFVDGGPVVPTDGIPVANTNASTTTLGQRIFRFAIIARRLLYDTVVMRDAETQLICCCLDRRGRSSPPNPHGYEHA